MQTRYIALWATFAIAAAAATAFAADWHPYGNARFNYWIDVPPGFSAIQEAENSDGGLSRSAEGHAELSVWGSYLTEGDFRSEARTRAGQDRADGWTVSLQKLQMKWTVWSGSKDGRIFYERAIPVCGGAAAYFRLEYDEGQARAFDAIIPRLGKSLRSGEC